MRLIVSLLIILCTVVAGCAPDETSLSSRTDAKATPTSAPPSRASPAPALVPDPVDNGIETGTSRRTRIITADSEFGPMLFDTTGQPIYLFTAESGDRPACYDECAEDWPPVLTNGEPRSAVGVRASLLGTTDRAEGTTQVTCAGHPLSYYAHEGNTRFSVTTSTSIAAPGWWSDLTARLHPADPIDPCNAPARGRDRSP